MRRGLNAVALAFLLALMESPAWAEHELTPDLAAAIQADQDRAMKAIADKHGRGKMGAAERKVMAREQAEAEAKSLEKHGVSAKEYSRYAARMSRADQARTAEAKKQIVGNEEAAAKKTAAQKAASGKPKEIEIQRGFSDDKANMMDAAPDTKPEK